jgi:hypothetical protein
MTFIDFLQTLSAKYVINKDVFGPDFVKQNE